MYTRRLFPNDELESFKKVTFYFSKIVSSTNESGEPIKILQKVPEKNQFTEFKSSDFDLTYTQNVELQECSPIFTQSVFDINIPE